MFKLFVFVLIVLPLQMLDAANYKVDLKHSHVGFKISHLVVSSVRGNFKEFTGSINIDPKTKRLMGVEGKAVASSIFTDEADRDNHLRSPDFFNVEKFPEISFKASAFSISPGKTGKMPGKLTMRGVTKDVVWDVEYRGTVKDPWGNQKAGLEARLTIDRKDFGLKWNKVMETGGLVVGDKVEMEVLIEAIAVKPAKPAKAPKKKK